MLQLNRPIKPQRRDNRAGGSSVIRVETLLPNHTLVLKGRSGGVNYAKHKDRGKLYLINISFEHHFETYCTVGRTYSLDPGVAESRGAVWSPIPRNSSGLKTKDRRSQLVRKTVPNYHHWPLATSLFKKSLEGCEQTCRNRFYLQTAFYDDELKRS